LINQYEYEIGTDDLEDQRGDFTRRGGLYRLAQGFYEAELVKAALQKSIFLKDCLVWTAIRRQGTYDWLFGA